MTSRKGHPAPPLHQRLLQLFSVAVVATLLLFLALYLSGLLLPTLKSM